MPVHSVFLDIDDTLISMEKGGPFDDDVAGIEKAWQKGIKFFLCTGRSLVQIPQVLADAGWKDGIVAAGGAHVILAGKTIYHNWVPVSVLCEIAGLFLAKNKKCGFRGDKHSYAVNQNGNKLPVTSAGDFAEKYADARVSMLTADHSIGSEERALLEEHFDIYWQIPHLDCFIKGEGKAKGMNLILDTLGLDRKYSVAIGDSSNDMDIIQCAGKGIAVGNACEELKEKALWISAPVGKGAVVKALEYLGLC
ncbi:MAG: Cof-type HAD-IIB family hydrolase [Treponema sp.]|nr:Cof-type HAD-IIB family hydrolase [Treponema sp.]